MKGVMSFLVASIFLLVLVSSASRLSVRAPDFSYQPIVAMHLQEEAVNAAFSDALSDAASNALAAAQAPGSETPAAVKTAVYLAALDFEAQIREAKYNLIFWCGAPTETALRDATIRMALEKNSVMPEGALSISDPVCLGSFDVNLLRKKVRVNYVGFSLYLKEAGMGQSVLLPSGFEGEIDG